MNNLKRSLLTQYYACRWTIVLLMTGEYMLILVRVFQSCGVNSDKAKEMQRKVKDPKQ